MITTIPIGVGWFIAIVAVVAIGSCIFATHASLHVERKEIAAEWLKIKVSNGILHHRMDIHDNRHRILCLREEAVSDREKRLRGHKHDLCQAAHDMAVQTNLAIHQTMDDDTGVAPLPELEA